MCCLVVGFVDGGEDCVVVDWFGVCDDEVVCLSIYFD